MQLLKAPICIVGAGPVGLTTALYLARKGIACTVVDKSRFPRHKACGDNISGNTIRTLQEFFPDFIEKFGENEKVADLRGAVVYAPNNHKFEIDYLPLETGTNQPSCYSIRRIDLDHFLIGEARTHDLIDLIEQASIQRIEKNSDGLVLYAKNEEWRIETKLAIIATGSNCSLPLKLGAYPENDRHTAVGIRAYFENVAYASGQHYSELYLTKTLMPGGLYITPLANGLVNVNVCMRKDVVRKKQINLKEEMLKTLKTHPLLQPSFKNARQVGKTEGSCLRLGTRKRRLSGDHFLLVGDAAGLIDLLSANGIPQGLASAKIAADTAAQCLQKGDFTARALSGYDRRVYKRVRHYLKLGKIIAPLMGYSLFNRASLGLMNFIARKFSRNEHLRNLMYDNEIEKTLLRPSFYYNVFFGVKNREYL